MLQQVVTTLTGQKEKDDRANVRYHLIGTACCVARLVCVASLFLSLSQMGLRTSTTSTTSTMLRPV